MTTKQFRQLTGLFFILGAMLVNTPYTLLIINFNYPDILREPVDQILTRFHAGGNSLIYTRLAFAWVGLPMFLGAIMLRRVLENEQSPLLEMATTMGILGFVLQVIGLLRWVFVVPAIARIYTNPTTSTALKDSISGLFLAIHQYGGVVLGEHIGQIFIIFWMSVISTILHKSAAFPKWVAWLGWVASAVYLLAQAELLATAMPDFPGIGWAGLNRSLLWLLWMIVMGIFLVIHRDDVSEKRPQAEMDATFAS